MSEGADRLREAIDLLLREVAVELPGPDALERLRTILTSTERLRAATLSAVRDLDVRELYALDAAGSARTWLRRQPGGEDGQVTLSRRLASRPVVEAALAGGRIGLRSATQLCTALEHVPDELDEALLTAVVRDGIGALLREQTGGTPEDEAAAAAVLAQRAADDALLTACCADVLTGPAARIEPAFVLLARRLPPAQLASALRLLLDPLQPDGTDQPAGDPYYLELRVLADGDVDLRGLLDPETGLSLAAEVERRLQAARTAATAPEPRQDEPVSDDPTTDDDPVTDPAVDPATGPAVGDDPLLGWDRAMAEADERAARRTAGPDGDPHRDPGHADRSADAPLRLSTLGRRRHDALRDLLTDAAASTGPGQPLPAHLTIITTLEAVEGRLGALPAQLVLPDGRTTTLRPETLQRLGCDSQLDAVLLGAAGTPVGASHTRRMPNRAERRALRARWGPSCAAAGCSRTRTVPHHVVPWWLSHLTRLADLVPLCGSCHHDLHEGHRTLRLRDGRLIDSTGWASTTAQTAAA